LNWPERCCSESKLRSPAAQWSGHGRQKKFILAGLRDCRGQ
jgi:hypothetical protein